MVTYLKDILLIVFFIFSPLVFYPYIYKCKNNIILYRSLLAVLFSVILIIVMTVPINIQGVIYDFRSVIVILGSLYGGPVVSLILFGLLVMYRWILGNPHMLIYIVSILPIVIIVLLTLKKYNPLKIKHKIIMAVILCTVMKLLTINIYLLLLGSADTIINNIIETIQTYIVQAFIIGVVVYLIELLIQYYYIQDEIYKSEKIKMVSEMAASVAHEIRNPLTTVKGFIQLLGSDLIENEKKEYYMDICLEELNRADLIISDYLSLAKTDETITKKINVTNEMNHLMSVLMTYANYNNINVETDFSNGNETYIIGDRNKFRQALINIGKNAIEAMEKGGTLSLEVIKLSDSVALRIRDTGVGMTQEQINKLGTPYYSTKEKGTGLGTMVTFAIIKKMNGKIEIKSEVNKGTEYTFTFPLVKGEVS
ncbi:MAG TPA: HAMP domain-containing sensor histidine kinase [Bacillus sp. (in: firmicutes)]|nr:HAMP domain-containing sensor histidine kinase [Bacillus sp. (in: firmicutes)]